MRPASRFRFAVIALLLFCVTAATADAKPSHGIAMHGEPAYAADFKNFNYVNPDAPKGGNIAYASLGTFNSTNPLIVKGIAAAGIRAHVFESLLARSFDEPFSLYGLLAKSIETAGRSQLGRVQITARGAVLRR